MYSRFATNISKAREAINTSAKKVLRSTQSNKEHVNTKALEKWRKKKEEEKENHPSWTNNPGSEKMAQAGFGGRKRKTRKRRKRRSSLRGGTMEKKEADAYRNLVRELQYLDPEDTYNPSKLPELYDQVKGSDLVNASTKPNWRCTKCGYTDQMPGQTYCRKCGEPIPCDAYILKEDRIECYRHKEREKFYEKQQEYLRSRAKGGRKTKRRKRRKRRRKRSRTRRGGIMDDDEKDEYEDVIEEFGGKERIVPGSNLPEAATKGQWRCTQETEFGDLCRKKNQKYSFKCEDPFCKTLMPCGNYKKPEDRSECKRYHQLLQNKAIYQERQWNKEDLEAQQRADSLRDAYNEGQGDDGDEETWSLDDEDIGPLEYGDSLSEKEEKKITNKFLKSTSKNRGKGFLSRMMSKVPKRTIWKRGKSHGGRRKTRRKKNKKKRTKKKARRRRRRSTKRGKGIFPGKKY